MFDITRFDRRNKPWEGVGANVEGTVHAADAIALAGLNWEVALQPLFLPGQSEPIDEKQAVVRTDKPGNEGLLGVVGNSYRPVQNRRAFEFLDGVVGEGLTYESAGMLAGGKKVFLQAHAPRTITVGKGDDIDLFVLLYNSHDGTTQLKAGLTPIRVKCYNTLMAALGGLQREIAIRHAQKLDERLEQAENLLALADRYAEGFKEMAQALRKQPVTDQYVSQLAQLVFPRARTQTSDPEAWEGVAAAMQHETNTLKGMDGTRWAAYNAVALYTDWGIRTRQGAGEDSHLAKSQRLQSIWLGDARTAKDRALTLLQRDELPQLKAA